MASVLFGRDLSAFAVDANNRFYRGSHPEFAVWFDPLATDRCLELYEVVEADGDLVRGDPVTVATADEDSLIQFFGPDGYDGPLYVTGPAGFPPLLMRPAYAGVSLGGGSVSAQALADDAVTRRAIAADAVGSDEIEAGAVGSTEIASGAVGTDELADDAVTGAKLADDAVGADQIAAGAVGTSEIANNAVTDAKIAGVALAKVTGAGTAAAANTGTGASNVILGNDARLTDARTPTAHKASHATGGSDALSPADIGAATSAQGAKADTAVQPARTISAGTGLTGGGDLSANRTLGIAAGGVGTTELAAGAVTNDKIASGIDLAKITPNPANFGAITTKGDLLAGTGAGQMGRLAAGQDGQVAVFDQTQTAGMRTAFRGQLAPLNVATATAHLATTDGFSGASATVASTTEWSATGPRALKVTATGAGATARLWIGGGPNSGTIPVLPNTPLTIHMDLRAGTGQNGKAHAVIVYFWTAAGNVAAATASVPAATVTISDSATVTATGTVVTPADCAFISLRVSSPTTSIGDAWYVDRVGWWHGYGGQWAPEGHIPNLGYRIVEATDTGRAGYVWDERNARPQMVYYDSGWRDVSALLVNGWAGSVYLRRSDNIILMRFDGLSGASATNDTILTIPTGFRSESTIQTILPANVSDNTAIRARMTNAGVVTMPRATATAVSATWSMSTTNALPSTLPGTAQGSIPNV